MVSLKNPAQTLPAIPTSVGQGLHRLHLDRYSAREPLANLGPRSSLYHSEAPGLPFALNSHPALDVLDPGSAGLLGTATHTSIPGPKTAGAPGLGTSYPKALGTCIVQTVVTPEKALYSR